MRTKRTTGQNLAELALKYITPLYIALVADNTGNNTGENTGLFACVQAVFATLCFVWAATCTSLVRTLTLEPAPT